MKHVNMDVMLMAAVLTALLAFPDDKNEVRCIAEQIVANKLFKLY